MSKARSESRILQHGARRACASFWRATSIISTFATHVKYNLGDLDQNGHTGGMRYVRDKFWTQRRRAKAILDTVEIESTAARMQSERSTTELCALAWQK